MPLAFDINAGNVVRLHYIILECSNVEKHSEKLIRSALITEFYLALRIASVGAKPR